MDSLFSQFIEEKEYIVGCSKTTIKGYNVAWRAFKKYGSSELTPESCNQFIINCRKSGITTRTINAWLAVFNSFLTWLTKNNHIEGFRIKLLKKEKKIQRSLTDNEIKKVINYKPKTWAQSRLHCLLLTLIDTGCRIEELLTLQGANIDFENMLIKVKGKGNKERIVPFSIELRKHLYKFLQSHTFSLAFPTLSGRRQDYDNIWLDFRYLCKKVGVQYGGFHMFRRTFARQYVKAGGNIFYLQQCLGHSSLETTKLYVEVGTEDLKQMHLKTSILGRLR